ncbi:hypothetical protein DFH06DRAFT_1255958 [Mycena polygramma]|nr:hypothetical protein DFH06DRAFT_1255958 [Mycena polygramma]
MASTSTSHRPSIVLPSIQDMFPEHLMSLSAPRPRHGRSFSRSYYVPQPPTPAPHSGFSFDVLKSDPRGSSLQHIASSRPNPLPLCTQPLPRVTSRAHSSSGSSDDDVAAEMDGDDDEDGTSASVEEVKRHICTTCGKRFNRPSSLRIHSNTHSGATPFRCPYPSCGRAFNVNSNMRRHFRHHTSSAFGANSNPNSNASSPVSPTSSSTMSYASSPTDRSPQTPLSPIPSPWQIHAQRWDTTPRSYRGVQGYRESDLRSQRR